MGQLIEFLKQNPIVLFLLLAGLANVIGNVVQARRKAAQQRPPQPRQKATKAAWPEQPAAPERGAARSAGGSPPVPIEAPGQGGRQADEVAAEMRRILGLDVEIQPVEPRTREPIRREPVRRPAEPEPVPAPVTAARSARPLPRHIDPHVGERITERKGVRSGGVGRHDASWGSLGGRRREPLAVGLAADERHIVDLSDLRRVILGAEILGPPLALRAPDQRMV